MKFTPEEALVVDSESLAVLTEQARMASGNYDSEAERLKGKWAAQDAQTRREISRRNTQISKQAYKKSKPFRK